MRRRLSLKRRLANVLVLRLLALAGPAERDWTLAMAAEVDAIGADVEALWFALGCWRVVWARQGLGAFARNGLAVLILAWACAKAYLAVWSGQYVEGEGEIGLPDWLPVAALVAGVAYVVMGVGLFLKRYGLVPYGLVCALMVNGILYGGVVIWPSAGAGGLNVWMMALALEDCFFWTGCLLGLGVVFWLGRDRAEVAA